MLPSKFKSNEKAKGTIDSDSSDELDTSVAFSVEEHKSAEDDITTAISDEIPFEQMIALSNSNIRSLYLQQENMDNILKTRDEQRKMDLLRELSDNIKKIQENVSGTEWETYSSSNPATTRSAKIRPKSCFSFQDKVVTVDTNLSPRLKDDFFETIPTLYARPNTARTPRRSSAAVKQRQRASTAKDGGNSVVSESKFLKEFSKLNIKEREKIETPFLEPVAEEYAPKKLYVSDEIKNLFLEIPRYTPLNINLAFKLKPFIPEYIPSVGDVDAYLKISTPDTLPAAITNTKRVELPFLGISTLDEPSKNQSDPAFLQLHLQAATNYTRKINDANLIVKKVSDVNKESSTIDKWIEDVSKLHLTKPMTKFSYSRPMPSMESLLQPWPPKLEALLKKNGFPSAKLNCSLSEYIDLVCTLLDIPVYDKKIESLHLLISMYLSAKKLEMSDQSRLKNISEITEEFLNNHFGKEKKNSEDSSQK